MGRTRGAVRSEPVEGADTGADGDVARAVAGAASEAIAVGDKRQIERISNARAVEGEVARKRQHWAVDLWQLMFGAAPTEAIV